ncbi:MAG: MalY/PatB family protein [Pseudomonadota bacterium]
MPFDFDRPIDRRQTNCSKWDDMESLFGVSPETGLGMWVADMDFAAPPAVNETLHNLAAHGVHGYFGNYDAYHGAIQHWMRHRHSWTVEEPWILTTHGIVHAIGAALQAYTEPGDGVIIFTPVYHVFHTMIDANDRRKVESPLKEVTGRYEMDLDALAGALTGDERLVILCSPHNPGGRVWTVRELRALADFCRDHDLILISDEIHHDLVYPGHTHTVMANAAPDILDRLVTLSAPSKTFNIAGAKNGQAIIPDRALRARMARVLKAAGTGTNRLGAMMTTAAYAHGEDWLKDLLAYLDTNRRIFDERINALPGVGSMELEATYLAWVDFSGTGMPPDEILRRVEGTGRIATNHGPSFGTGGENRLRFNIGTQMATIRDALERIEHAFSDLQ